MESNVHRELQLLAFDNLILHPFQFSNIPICHHISSRQPFFPFLCQPHAKPTANFYIIYQNYIVSTPFHFNNTLNVMKVNTYFDPKVVGDQVVRAREQQRKTVIDSAVNSENTGIVTICRCVASIWKLTIRITTPKLCKILVSKDHRRGDDHLQVLYRDYIQSTQSFPIINFQIDT